MTRDIEAELNEASDIERLTEQRDELFRGIRKLLRNTGSGIGLANTIHTRNGKETATGVEQALAAIDTFIERDKKMRDDHAEERAQLRGLQDDMAAVRRVLGTWSAPSAG